MITVHAYLRALPEHREAYLDAHRAAPADVQVFESTPISL